MDGDALVSQRNGRARREIKWRGAAHDACAGEKTQASRNSSTDDVLRRTRNHQREFLVTGFKEICLRGVCAAARFRAATVSERCSFASSPGATSGPTSASSAVILAAAETTEVDHNRDQ